MHRLSKTDKLRFTLLLFYSLIILLPVIAFFSSYFSTLDFLIDREMKVQSQLTHSKTEVFRSSLLYADAYTDAVMSTAYMQAYLSASNEPSNHLVSRMQKMRDAFPLLHDQNGLIDRMFIYSSKSATILDRYSGYLNIERYYDKLFSLEGYDYFQWKETLLESDAYAEYISTKDEDRREVILYSHQLPVYPRNSGRIVFYIDKGAVIRLLSSTDQLRNSYTLYDNTGKLLLCSNTGGAREDLFTRYGAISDHLEIKSPGAETQIVFSTDLPTYGWRLYTSIPKHYFVERALQMSVSSLRNLIPLSLLLGACLFLILRYSHQPMRSAILSVSDAVDVSTANPFRYVQQSLHELTSVSKEQAYRLQRSQQEMQEAILSMLVYQKHCFDFPLDEKLKEYGLNFESDRYRALILTLRDMDGNDFLPISNQIHIILEDLALQFAPTIRYIKMDGPKQMK